MKTIKKIEVKKLTDLPNVGPATAKKFNHIGIKQPNDLKNKDAIQLFKKLCRVSGIEHDHCTADIFMSAVSFMNGNMAKPWWYFTKKRKSFL